MCFRTTGRRRRQTPPNPPGSCRLATRRGEREKGKGVKPCARTKPARARTHARAHAHTHTWTAHRRWRRPQCATARRTQSGGGSRACAPTAPARQWAGRAIRMGCVRWGRDRSHHSGSWEITSRCSTSSRQSTAQHNTAQRSSDHMTRQQGAYLEKRCAGSEEPVEKLPVGPNRFLG